MPPIIDVQFLRKAFGTLQAVDDLSFSVPTGSLFAFLGQNGAGKSTTIHMLIGLLPPDGGAVRYDGGDYAAFRDRMGVVFQQNVLDDKLSVEENLRLYGALHRHPTPKQRLRELYALLSLEDIRGQRAGTLSGGQRRRAEIARALWSEPRVLFLDEPTTGLDPQTRAQVWEVIHRLRRETGMTVFLTTHYMEETADADAVVIIHKGKLLAQGSPAQLKATYSEDRLLLTPADAALLERQLGERRIEFTRTADTYTVSAGNTAGTIALLYDIQDNIRFFEMRRGTMDDVFLRATGEAINHGEVSA